MNKPYKCDEGHISPKKKVLIIIIVELHVFIYCTLRVLIIHNKVFEFYLTVYSGCAIFLLTYSITVVKKNKSVGHFENSTETFSVYIS